MITYVIAIILVCITLLMTIFSKKIATLMFKKEQVDSQDIQKVKLIALAIGIADFLFILFVL